MNKANARALKRILASKDVRASLKTFLAQQTRTAPVKPMKKARLAKEDEVQLSEKKETKRLWRFGHQRAKGLCECGCGRAFDRTFWGRETLDHYDNGPGKTQRQTEQNTWKLRWWCHDERQNHRPSTAYWNAKFRAHCERNGIPDPFQHIEHAPLPSSTPSVPAADTPLPDKGIGGVDLKQEQLSEKEG